LIITGLVLYNTYTGNLC